MLPYSAFPDVNSLIEYDEVRMIPARELISMLGFEDVFIRGIVGRDYLIE